MAGTFNFCPTSQVPELIPPDPITGVSMNGWYFSSKPKVPYQRRFRVTLHGLRWYLAPDGSYDTSRNPTINARLLEKFYEDRQTWDTFTWLHPHLGILSCRFGEPVTVPAAMSDSGGLLEAVEVVLVHNNPGFS